MLPPLTFGKVPLWTETLPKEKITVEGIEVSEIYNTTVHICCIIEKIKVRFHRLRKNGTPHFRIFITQRSFLYNTNIGNSKKGG